MAARCLRNPGRFSSAALYELFVACARRSSDDQIEGFRAIIPYIRQKEYERTTPLNDEYVESGRGVAGLFKQLLSKHPSLVEFLSSQVKKYVGDEWIDRRLPVRTEHSKFLARLAEKISLNAYPFTHINQGREGYRLAFHVELDRQRSRNAGSYRPSVWRDFIDLSNDFYRRVQMDAHRLDKHIPVKFIGRKNRTVVRLVRPWLLVLHECESSATVGFYITYEKEPSFMDCLYCIYDAMRPKVRREMFEIEDLSYEESAGFPSELFERCKGRFFDTIEMDNALAQHTEALRTVGLNGINAVIKFGLPANPRTRSEVEQKFNSITHRSIQHLPGGLRPDMSNAERKRALKEAAKYAMTEGQVDEYMEVTLANANGAPNSAFYGKSALDYLGEEGEAALVRSDNSLTASWKTLLVIEEVVPVRASKGHVAHINYANASYSNDTIRSVEGLINTDITIKVNLADLQTCEAFDAKGRSLGVLLVERRWRFPHDYRLRKKLNQAIYDGRFVWSSSKTPEECVRDFLDTPRSKKRKAVEGAKHKPASHGSTRSPGVKREVPAQTRGQGGDDAVAKASFGEVLDLQAILGKRLKG